MAVNPVVLSHWYCLFAPPHRSGSQDFEKAGKGVPVASGNRAAETLLELAQEGNGSHSSPVDTKGESPSNCNDPNQPVLAGREMERKYGRDAEPFGQNADEADYVRPARFPRKGFCRGQADDVIPWTDHRLGFAGKTSSEFHSQLCLANRLPNHKGSCCADVINSELGQPAGKDIGTNGLVPAHVDIF